MSTVEEIKEAIDHLSAEERAQLLTQLDPAADDDWDRQMKADAAAGKLDFLMEEAEAERKAGTLREFPEPDEASLPPARPAAFGKSSINCLCPSNNWPAKTTNCGWAIFAILPCDLNLLPVVSIPHASGLIIARWATSPAPTNSRGLGLAPTRNTIKSFDSNLGVFAPWRFNPSSPFP